MQRLEIEEGTVFGELTVIREVYSPNYKRKFLCKCSCGNKREVRIDHLRSGHTASCGRCGVKHNGERRPLIEWARMYGIPESTLRTRLKTMKMREALEREVR